MTWFPQQFIDITLPLSRDTIVYPGDSPPEIHRVTDLHAGDSLTASVVTLGCHIGTHIDAPAHFLAQGKMVHELPLESFYGSALVVSQQGKECIHQSDLEELSIPSQYHIFFKTDNGVLLNEKVFSEEYCVLSRSAAEFVCQFKPLSVGWDYYSLDAFSDSKSFPAHRVFAEANIPVFVCLNLQDVPEGQYGFSGFPLRLEGVEGAPVRAILIREDKS
ncbi:MAG: cyclase family protein [Nitrospirae bacterium]|nr:cyclase family protein [Nitrospirota bacterium]MDA1304653.1 cyclase family protein [Nitrospirota bacterium]